MNYITDRFTIPSSREFTPEGYLIVKDSKIARVGVLTYMKAELPTIKNIPSNIAPDHIVRVFRGPDQLFKDSTLNSFKSKPMTLKHPEDFVNASNIKDTNVGFAKDDITHSGDFMTASLVITDSDAIEKIKSGVKELSLGYTADIIWRPGVTDTGEAYDAVQENIFGNHIAIVPRGRCGAPCKISDNKNNKGAKMPDQIVIDGITYDCPAQTAQAFKKVQDTNISLTSKLKDAEEAKKKAEDDKDDMEEEGKKVKDSMQAKLDEAESSKVKDSDLDALVADRSEIVTKAGKIVKDFDGAGKSNFEIKKEVVKDSCPDLDLATKSNDYIEARFDAILDGSATAPKKSAITDAFKDHAKGSTALQDSGLSKSALKRQTKIEDNRKKNRGES